MRYLPAVLALAVAVSAGCDPADRGRGGEATSPAGSLVSVGGALAADNEAIYRAMLDRRHGGGPFCILPTAGGDADGSGAAALARFERYVGPGTTRVIPLTEDDPARAADPEIVRELSGCSGYFFVGGQQSRVTRVFGTAGAPTPALEAILVRYREGAVVAGTSAGAAIMSDPMIAGGTSETALLEGVSHGEGEGAGVRLTGGFGLLDGVIVDQHFLARGRIGRLVMAVLDPDTPDRGIGVDENTAAVVENGTLRVVGVSGVILLDASGARPDPGGRGGEGVLVSLLGDGDLYDLGVREVIRGTGKRVIVPTAPEREVPGDLFERGALVDFMIRLAGSIEEEVEVVTSRYRAVLRKAPGFRAVARSGEDGAGEVGEAGERDPGDVPPGFGAGPFLLDLHAGGGLN